MASSVSLACLVKIHSKSKYFKHEISVSTFFFFCYFTSSDYCVQLHVDFENHLLPIIKVLKTGSRLFLHKPTQTQ